ncbi:MAG: SusC/RagA family TonB-linked outer membrane protein [Candidatus Marinimicrobia bacterium]|jgi:TonB-linked SusC/RagA family outer membrane protein|nr:SusC/RagA family TonB-linked outer membrane protein [Candidatus Neomarinimicrobiota bacterium]
MRTIKTILIALLVTTTAFASVTVEGTITDANTGEALIGAQVLVKGTFTGTTTGQDGRFNLNVDDDATLIFTYIGYKTTESVVSPGMGSLAVAMELDVLGQDELVVTGLVTSVKRRNAANAVSVVSGDDLVNAPTQTLDQALSGKFAGVNIRRNTGAPGGGVNVNLRGSSTLTGSTQPIYVIDGIVVNNDANQSGIDVVTAAAGAGSSRPQGQPTNRIGDINPNDIESVEVLKGASAAAMYGAKASNGVIIINTKKGQGGNTKFNFSTRTGSSELLKKMGHRVFETYEEAEAQFGSDIADLGNNASGTWANNDFDYEEILYGESGQLTEHTLSAIGGNARTQFYIGGQYMDEGGIIVNTGYKKLSGRVNVSHRFSDKAKLSVSTNLVRSESDRGVTGNDNTNMTYGFSIGFTPSFIDIRDTDDDGVFPSHPTNPSNPLETAAYFVNNELTHRALGSLTFDYNLLKQSNQSLGFLAVAGADFYNQENEVFIPPFLQIEEASDEPGQSVMTTTDNLNTNLSLNLVHKLKMSNMNFTTTAGLQYETRDWNSVFVHATGMIPTQTNVDKASSQAVYHDKAKRQDRGQFFQVEGTIGDNIYAAFGMRGDVSSTMGDTETMEWYPKLAASYQFGEFAGVFDNLKLRFASGETGNMPQPKAKYTTMSSANIGGINGLIPSSTRGNPDVVPERTAETEFGADFSMMGGLATVEATMYTQNITDLILLVDLPASSGASAAWENGGEMETKGTELSLGLNPTKLVGMGGIDWNFRMNYYTSESEVTVLNVDPYNYGGFATFLGTYRIEEGWSPTAIVGSEMEFSHVDTDGDTVMKHVELGNENPDYRVSFSNSFRLGPVEFSFLIDHKEGGSAINLANLIYDLGGTTADYDTEDLDLDGDGVMSGNGNERLTVLGGVTAPYIESTTYTSLRDVSLTYTLPGSVSNRLGLGYLKLGFAGRNLWLKTDYTGLSPEVSQFGNEAVGGSVDTNPFPLSKSMYLTLSIGL